MPSNNSPLRYPGGKSQLAKYISHILKLNKLYNVTYCEAFCGGAGVAITLLLKNNVDRIILNDSDPAIYSIWYAILNDFDRFVSRIQQIPVTIEEWHSQHKIYNSLKYQIGYSFELAIAAFFLNRTNHSGIIEGGPIGGYEQKSNHKINCRFNKDSLLNKFDNIHALNNRIELYNYDGIEFIHRIIEPLQENIFTFFDPPYFKQGKNLYKNSLNYEYHNNLTHIIQNLRHHHWIVTYDDAEEIRKLYANCTGWNYTIHYTANLKRKESELMYSNHFTQLDSFNKVNLKAI